MALDNKVKRRVLRLGLRRGDCWEEVGSLFSKLLGRCLRGRWGSVDSVEGALLVVMAYAGPVFEAVFGTDVPLVQHVGACLGSSGGSGCWRWLAGPSLGW